MRLLPPLLLLVLLTGTGCGAAKERRWTARTARMQACRARWVNVPQQGPDTLRVIYYQKAFRFDMAHFPHFVIGTTTAGDTIGFVDRTLPDSAEVGERVAIAPAPWSAAAMDTVRPADQVFEKDRLNALYCAVRSLHFGQLAPLP